MSTNHSYFHYLQILVFSNNIHWEKKNQEREVSGFWLMDSGASRFAGKTSFYFPIRQAEDQTVLK